ncbi:MAG: hypothetical protein WCI11_18500 [Candidatus Methylumidiphilus sp.]
MSKLLDALIELRRKGMLSYKDYLAKIATLTKEAVKPEGGGPYPPNISTAAKRALYNNLEHDEALRWPWMLRCRVAAWTAGAITQ